MRIGFLYDNCLGFDLTSDYTDIILSTVAAVVYNGVAFTWSLCSSCTEEERWSPLGRRSRIRYRTHSGARLSISS